MCLRVEVVAVLDAVSLELVLSSVHCILYVARDGGAAAVAVSAEAGPGGNAVTRHNLTADCCL